MNPLLTYKTASILVLSAGLGLFTAPGHTSVCQKPKVTGYQQVECLSEGLAAVKKNDKWGFVTLTGKVVIAPKYDNLTETVTMGKAPYPRSNLGFSEGLVGVFMINGHKDAIFQNPLGSWGFINTQGNMVIAPQYSDAGRFSEGLAFVANQDALWGVIDKTGKLTIPYQYDGKSVSTFSEGLADVYYDGSQGYIDKKGTLVIPPQYYSAGAFHKGYAPVMPSPKEEACINKKAQVVKMKFCQR